MVLLFGVILVCLYFLITGIAVVLHNNRHKSAVITIKCSLCRQNLNVQVREVAQWVASTRVEDLMCSYKACPDCGGPLTFGLLQHPRVAEMLRNKQSRDYEEQLLKHQLEALGEVNSKK